MPQPESHSLQNTPAASPDARPVLAPIPSAPGYYASTDGDIYSEVTCGLGEYPKLMTPSNNGQGYYTIGLTLTPGAIPTSRGIHRLVAEAFFGPPFPGAHASHLDADPSNNRPSNLRWEDATTNQRRKARRPPPVDALRCTATTRLGQRCKRGDEHGGLCWQHWYTRRPQV